MDLVFKRKHDFYDLPEEERKALIGKTFREEGRRDIFVPVQLASGEFNYGVQQGLIVVTQLLKDTEDGSLWFRVAASSPDDLDRDLDFTGTGLATLRRKIVAFLKQYNKTKVTYRGLLEEVQKHFNAGDISP